MTVSIFISRIPQAIWRVYFVSIFGFSLLLFYPFFYFNLSSPKRFKIAFWWMKRWSKVLQIMGGVYLIKKGAGNLPKKGPFIICSNHSSYWDIILMYQVFTDYYVFMGKQELASWPLFGKFFTSGMNILVDRASRTGAHKSFVEAGERIDRGESVMIFPEGAIPNSAPKMKGFKNGAIKLAIEKQVPIIPITFTTNWKRLQGTVLLKGKGSPGISEVFIHPVINTEGMTENDIISLRTQLFEVINAPLKNK